jgi:hypothetical protein
MDFLENILFYSNKKKQVDVAYLKTRIFMQTNETKRTMIINMHFDLKLIGEKDLEFLLVIIQITPEVIPNLSKSLDVKLRLVN